MCTRQMIQKRVEGQQPHRGTFVQLTIVVQHALISFPEDHPAL